VRVVRVLPDEPAIDKTFDYLVPDALGDQVRVGAVVRVALHGRRVGGWVVADAVEPPAGVVLAQLAKVTGWGPPPELVDLARWAAWRWAGRPAHLLRTATAERAVPGVPPPWPPPGVPPTPVGHADVVAEAFDGDGPTVVRLPPTADPFDLAAAAVGRGPALVLAPSVAGARRFGLRLRRAGAPVAILPEDWARARAGSSVIGTRAGAWAPLPVPSAVVVIDEHDEAYQQERSPTWHARDVAVERARRAGVPCVLVSPCPSLEALAVGGLVRPSRAAEREGWPKVDVVDLRREDPVRGGSLVTERLAHLVQDGARVACVLNRTGRARLLACRACRELARCETCDAAVGQADDGTLVCPRCASWRPVVCLRCGSTGLRVVRAGVTKLRDDLALVARGPVVEVTAASSVGPVPADAQVYVGTEAVLHQLDRIDVVAFVDLDQELLAPRYRAAEQALALLARAARLVGPRSGPGRLLVQTAVPSHEVVQAAVLGDPDRVRRAEQARRAELSFPPVTAMAEVSGAAAPAFVAALGSPLGVEVLGPVDDRWLLRAPDHRTLCDALAEVTRPPGRLRIAVDPLRI
jgi:primosomal protein N' (replication factor Y)